MATWHDQGENRVLNVLLGAQPVDGAWYMGLYTNVTALAEDAELADLVEPSGFGYSRKTLTRGSWTITNDQALYALQTFLASGGDWGDIAGYFIATSVDSSGKLIASEHFTTALNVKDGKGIKITPKITVS